MENTDAPPRVYGVEMQRNGARLFSAQFGCVLVTSEAVAGEGYCWRIANGLLHWNKTPAEAALAIEAELTRIETEIRTAREGKK